MEILDQMNEIERDEAVEDSITLDEKSRADAIEAILLYDSMIKARESKE